MLPRANKRINLRRLTVPSGFHGSEDIYTVKPDFWARIEFSPQAIVNADGEVQSVDAFLTVDGSVDIRPRDVIEIIPDVSTRYTVESIEESLRVTGKIDRKRANLVKNESVSS